MKEPYQHGPIMPLKEMEEVETETVESEMEEQVTAPDVEEEIEEAEQPVFVNSMFLHPFYILGFLGHDF